MNIIQPRPIHPGDTIGIIAPSSPIAEDTLEEGLKAITDRGYKIERGRHLGKRWGYLGGSDQERADDLHEMFVRDDVHGIMCARGGFGAARLMPYLKPEVFRNHPKLFAGYSDVTVLNLWMLQACGLVTFYSPMPITFSREVPDEVIAQMWRAFEEDTPVGTLPLGDDGVKTVVGGKARGLVTGGCLCLICYSIGSPFEIETKDRIVVIEDVDEPPYRMDGMLTQLGQAGKWSAAAGIVIGEDSHWEEHIDKEKPHDTLTPDELWVDRVAPHGRPTITGFPFGHVHGPLTLPFGVMAELDADAGTLTYLESATSP